MKLEINKILPKDWKYNDFNNKIRIWYENKRKNPQPLTINKNLLISKELGTLFGFWAGDGTKNNFVLTNTNFDLMRISLSILQQYFNLDNKEFKLRINIPINLKSKTIEIQNKIKNLFPEIVNVKFKVHNKKRNYPHLNIRQDKTIFIQLFKLIYDYLIKNLSRDHIFWDGYISGIVSAEGHMDLRKQYKTLSRISIAQTNEITRNLIFEILKNRNIEYTKNKGYITIFGKKNYDIIFQRDLYSLHPHKKRQFLEGYHNIKQKQYSDEEAEINILKNIKTPNRVSNIAKIINRHRQTIRDHMQLKSKSLIEKGLIKKCGKERGSRGSFYGELWTLTKKGSNYLNNYRIK